jgi:hypothetical protein
VIDLIAGSRSNEVIDLIAGSRSHEVIDLVAGRHHEVIGLRLNGVTFGKSVDHQLYEDKPSSSDSDYFSYSAQDLSARTAGENFSINFPDRVSYFLFLVQINHKFVFGPCIVEYCILTHCRFTVYCLKGQ